MGARSGKSEVAESLAASSGHAVTYLATASVSGDADWQERVARHRARRPASWATLEVGSSLVEALNTCTGTVLVESLGTWVAGCPGFEADVDGLLAALASRQGWTILVGEEVGLGVHPSTDVGGQFRDVLGTINQAVAGASDEVLFVIAGRVLRLDPAPPASG